MRTAHSKTWLTEDEIDFILHIAEEKLIKIMPVLRSREWGDLDGKKIMEFAERRLSRINKP